jgi:hypothetical protein
LFRSKSDIIFILSANQTDLTDFESQLFISLVWPQKKKKKKKKKGKKTNLTEKLCFGQKKKKKKKQPTQ